MHRRVRLYILDFHNLAERIRRLIFLWFNCFICRACERSANDAFQDVHSCSRMSKLPRRYGSEGAFSSTRSHLEGNPPLSVRLIALGLLKRKDEKETTVLHVYGIHFTAPFAIQIQRYQCLHQRWCGANQSFHGLSGFVFVFVLSDLGGIADLNFRKNVQNSFLPYCCISACEISISMTHESELLSHEQ
jgi:hypothetical protein